MKFEQKEIAKFNDLVKNAGNYSLYKKWTKKEKKLVLNPEYDLEKSMQYYQQALDLFVSKYGKYRGYVEELEEYDVCGNLLERIAYLYSRRSYKGMDLHKSIEICLEIIKDDDTKKLHDCSDKGIYFAYLLLGAIYSNKENEKYGIEVDGEKAIEYFSHSPRDGYYHIARIYYDGFLSRRIIRRQNTTLKVHYIMLERKAFSMRKLPSVKK